MSLMSFPTRSRGGCSMRGPEEKIEKRFVEYGKHLMKMHLRNDLDYLGEDNTTRLKAQIARKDKVLIFPNHHPGLKFITDDYIQEKNGEVETFTIAFYYGLESPMEGRVDEFGEVERTQLRRHWRYLPQDVKLIDQDGFEENARDDHIQFILFNITQYVTDNARFDYSFTPIYYAKDPDNDDFTMYFTGDIKLDAVICYPREMIEDE